MSSVARMFSKNYNVLNIARRASSLSPFAAVDWALQESFSTLPKRKALLFMLKGEKPKPSTTSHSSTADPSAATSLVVGRAALPQQSGIASSLFASTKTHSTAGVAHCAEEDLCRINAYKLAHKLSIELVSSNLVFVEELAAVCGVSEGVMYSWRRSDSYSSNVPLTLKFQSVLINSMSRVINSQLGHSSASSLACTTKK